MFEMVIAFIRSCGSDARSMVSSCCVLIMDKLQIAITALEKIANPVKHAQEYAKKHRLGLNGPMVVSMSENAGYLKSIAQSALQDIENYDKKSTRTSDPLSKR
jgi:hypothetical protein